MGWVGGWLDLSETECACARELGMRRDALSFSLLSHILASFKLLQHFCVVVDGLSIFRVEIPGRYVCVLLMHINAECFSFAVNRYESDKLTI